eukprot:2556299-Amphidinium_carterae.1
MAKGKQSICESGKPPRKNCMMIFSLPSFDIFSWEASEYRNTWLPRSLLSETPQQRTRANGNMNLLLEYHMGVPSDLCLHNYFTSCPDTVL